jgi:hypothetical protein
VGGRIFKAWVVWAAVAGLRLVVRVLELMLLAAPTRLRLQLLAFLIAASLLLATLATLLMLLLPFIRHAFTPLDLQRR